MTKRALAILIVSLTLIGSTAGLLGYWKTNQRLGEPGVKVVAQPIFDPDGKLVGTNSALLPEAVLDFKSKPAPISPMEVFWLPKDTTFGRRHYTAPDNFQMLMTIVLMGTDRTSIHKPEGCLTGVGWRIESGEQTTIPIRSPHPYDLPVMKITATGAVENSAGSKVTGRGLYVYWFVADDRLTASHNERMLSIARELMFTGTLQRWAYVSCFATCLPGQEEAAFQRIKQFLAEAVPTFQLATGNRTDSPKTAASHIAPGPSGFSKQ
jgi:hypothetical protein